MEARSRSALARAWGDSRGQFARDWFTTFTFPRPTRSYATRATFKHFIATLEGAATLKIEWSVVFQAEAFGGTHIYSLMMYIVGCE